MILEEKSKDWALVCLNERHSDEKLKTISKETRDILSKKNIEKYLNNTLSETDRNDVFKGLLKSYFVNHESIKILERINLEQGPKEFTLNGISFEINHYSFVHIINRHYAEILSSQSIVLTKSFHNTKIDPYSIHFFIKNLILLIKSKGIESNIRVHKGQEILIKFHEIDYALCFNEYKYDKSKIILNTFFVIEAGNKNAQRLIDRINISRIIKLDDDLSIYIDKKENKCLKMITKFFNQNLSAFIN